MFRSEFLLQLHKKYLFRTLIFNIYPSTVHENAYIKINKFIDYKMSSSYQSFFSLISICSQLNTTRQKKADLYIFCGWDSFVSLDTLKRHTIVLKICLTTQKSSQVTDILCAAVARLIECFCITCSPSSQKVTVNSFFSLIWFPGLLASYSTIKEAHKAKKALKVNRK